MHSHSGCFEYIYIYIFCICDFLLNTKNTVLIAMLSDRLFCEIFLIMHINVKCFFYIYLLSLTVFFTYIVLSAKSEVRIAVLIKIQVFHVILPC